MMYEIWEKRGRVFLNLLMASLLCLILPLVGVKLAGRPIHEYLELPPLSYRMNYLRFHWGAFLGFIALALISCALWLRGYAGGRRIEEYHFLYGRHPFPWWGWLGLAFGLAAWMLAWTRLDWFAPYQAYTFIAQWLSFVVVMNALTHWRSGQCPMCCHPGSFLKLFLASAVLWWVFEYLNRFVSNWIYEDASYRRNPLEYILFATLAFSTVIPGVLSTKRFLDTFSGLQRFLARGPAVSLPRAKAFQVVAVLAVGAGFLMISWYPRALYPILWIGPFVAWMSLNGLLGIPSGFGSITEGDWRVPLGWGLAALTCGVFWEMWNYYSMSRWTYQVPYLEGFKVFEMPIAGYSGYLAFGLECAMAVEIVQELSQPRG